MREMSGSQIQRGRPCLVPYLSGSGCINYVYMYGGELLRLFYKVVLCMTVYVVVWSMVLLGNTRECADLCASV